MSKKLAGETLRDHEHNTATALIALLGQGSTSAGAELLRLIRDIDKRQPVRRVSLKHAKQDRLIYLAQSLGQAEMAVQSAIDHCSWQAVATNKRLALSVRDQYDEEQTKRENTAAAMETLTADQLVDQVIAAVELLPAALLEPIMDALFSRVKPAEHLRLLDGE